MSDETANQDIENTAKNMKSSEQALEVIKEIESIFRSNKNIIFWLAYQQVEIFERTKLNNFLTSSAQYMK